jgi:hypothetical protein
MTTRTGILEEPWGRRVLLLAAALGVAEVLVAALLLTADSRDDLEGAVYVHPPPVRAQQTIHWMYAQLNQVRPDHGKVFEELAAWPDRTNAGAEWLRATLGDRVAQAGQRTPANLDLDADGRLELVDPWLRPFAVVGRRGDAYFDDVVQVGGLPPAAVDAKSVPLLKGAEVAACWVLLSAGQDGLFNSADDVAVRSIRPTPPR